MMYFASIKKNPIVDFALALSIILSSSLNTYRHFVLNYLQCNLQCKSVGLRTLAILLHFVAGNGNTNIYRTLNFLLLLNEAVAEMPTIR